MGIGPNPHNLYQKKIKLLKIIKKYKKWMLSLLK